MLIEVTVTIQVHAPDDATHYTGDLLDEPRWYKMKMMLCEHWFYRDPKKSQWILYGHVAPYGLKEIPVKEVR